MISFACPHCSKRYSVPDHKAGMRAKCRKCREPIVVPPPPAVPPWRGDTDDADAGTAERAKTPTDADLVLPAGVGDSALLAAVRPAADRLPTAPVLFAVQLEYAEGALTTTAEADELYAEARRFLADVLYAYRHRLAPAGARLTTIRVDEVERVVEPPAVRTR